MLMNKLPVIFLALVGVGVVGVVACPSGGATSCTSDADCTSDATNPVCDASTKVCVPAECTVDDAGNAQCAATDAGSSAACSTDTDCTTAGDKCVKGSNDTNHCVAVQAAGDPTCESQTPPATTFNGSDSDGSAVTFCDSSAPKCSAPGKCG
jgi:hypothetical protein